MSTSAAVRSIASPDGTSIGFSRSGAGRPLVLVHGTSAGRSRWEPVLPSLERRFTVYAMDRRGRGSSGDAQEYSLEREIEDVESVVRAVGEPLTLQTRNVKRIEGGRRPHARHRCQRHLPGKERHLMRCVGRQI